MDCFYCAKDERLLALMTPLAGGAFTDIYLFHDQKHRGRCVVALRGHKNELYELTDAEREGFFLEAAAAAEAIAAYTGADKINYAIYGDLVSHFHIHLVPKKKGALQWGGPFTDDLPKLTLPAEEFAGVARGLLGALGESCGRRGVPLTVCFPGLRAPV